MEGSLILKISITGRIYRGLRRRRRNRKMGRGINCLNLGIRGSGSGIVGLNLGGGMRIMIFLLCDRLYNID